MADQNAAATEAEQQADSSVQETGAQEQAVAQENWEQRFKDTQAWATRLTQEKAELEAQTQIVQQLKSDDPVEQRKALEALGYQVPEEADEDSPVYEPDPRLRAELDELKQWRDSLTEEQTREANYSDYRGMVDPQLTEMGVPDGLHDVVAEAALNLPPIQSPQGPQPDLKGAMEQVEAMADAFAALPAVQKAVRKSWGDTKPRSPVTSAGGGEGTQVLDMDKHENRVAVALARLQDGQQ